MANYIGQVVSPRLSSRHFGKIVVPAGGLYSGQVVYATQLDNSILGNTDVYVATQPTTALKDNNFLAVVLNDGYETLVDGRRVGGQPNYYQYQYRAGDIAPIVFCDEHICFNISADSIDPNTIASIAVGKFLVPLNGSNNLAVADDARGYGCSLKVLSAYNTPIGGNYGGGFASSFICVSDNEYIDTGANFLSFTFPNQVGTSVIDRTNHTITANIAGSRASIAPSFILSRDAIATIGGVTQVSGVTANNYTASVTYIVTSESGETQSWNVTISLQQYSLEGITEDAHSTLSVTRGGVAIGIGVYNLTYGDQLVISATTDANYILESLTVNGEEFATGGTLTVTSDVNIVATSIGVEYDLTISDTNAETTVTVDGEPVASGEIIHYGDILTISSIAVSPATSVAITVNGTPFVSGGTFTVTSDITIVANGSFVISTILNSDYDSDVGMWLKIGDDALSQILGVAVGDTATLTYQIGDSPSQSKVVNVIDGGEGVGACLGDNTEGAIVLLAGSGADILNLTSCLDAKFGTFESGNTFGLMGSGSYSYGTYAFPASGVKVLSIVKN